MITIVDYGASNLASVRRAFAYLGYKTRVAISGDQLAGAKSVVLPGVGSFASAMSNLEARDFKDPLRRLALSGVPLLGICLGLQLFAEHGSEGGQARGLGLLPGSVDKLTGSVKLPHVGWNQVAFLEQNPLVKGLASKESFYFVHSFHFVPEDARLLQAVCHHGQTFAAIAGRENVYGVQFHPEKSGAAGLRLLENFASMR